MSIISEFHNDSFPGYDNIPTTTIKPLEERTLAKQGEDYFIKNLLSNEEKQALENRNLREDVLEILGKGNAAQARKEALNNNAIINPESASKEIKEVASEAAQSAKSHKVLAIGLSATALATAIAGVIVKKAIDAKKAEAQDGARLNQVA